MMLATYRSTLTLMIVLFSFSGTASAGTTSVEINANADDVAGIVEYHSPALGAVLNFGGGILFSENDYTIGNIHFALKDEIFTPALTLGLGFKGLAGQAEIGRRYYDIAGIGFALSGEYDFRKIYLNFPILIYAEMAGAPDPMSFGDTTSYLDFSIGIRGYIVRNAAAVVGYRNMDIRFKDNRGKEKLTDDAFYIGLQLTF